MTPEVAALGFAVLLQAVHWGVLVAVARDELDDSVLLGPRDTPPVLSPRLGRLYRAFHNHYEALVLFAAAVLVVELSSSSSALTAVCAWLFLSVRILYVPAYVLGLNPWRSVLWFAGLVAIVVMVAAALL